MALFLIRNGNFKQEVRIGIRGTLIIFPLDRAIFW